jgi:hypothetical protein
MFTITELGVVVNGRDADPLSVQALAFGDLMAIFLIILCVTIALAGRVGVRGLRLSSLDSETIDDTGLVDTVARTLTLVLMSLIGLYALGVTYGNVLGGGTP